MKTPHIIAVGGAHVDRRGQTAGAYVPGASNPGTMREDVGGGVFNALRQAVRRGVAGSLMSVRGGDEAGERVSRAIAAAGIRDLSAVFLDRATPSYTAILDKQGDVVAALADMGLYEIAFPKQVGRAKLREAVGASDAVLCDANLPALALKKLMAIASGKPVFAIAISPAKAARLAETLPALACLFMNRREAAELAGCRQEEPLGGMIDRLRASGLAGGVISDGGNPAAGFDGSGAFAVDPPRPRKIVDVTGAGDALAGATVAAMLRGAPLREALREGMAAAMLTLESGSSVAECPPADFAEALALVPRPSDMR